MERWLTWVDRALTAGSVLAILIMLVVTMVSVTGRYLFNSPIPDDIVMNELLMVFLVFLPLAFAQRKQEHVVVTLLSDRMSWRAQQFLSAMGHLLGALAFGLVTFASWGDFWQGWLIRATNEGVLALPNYPSHGALVLGVGVFTLRLLFDFVQDVKAMCKPIPQPVIVD